MATRAEIPPHVFVVFGATGDLMRRKLLPALARLGAKGTLRRQVVVGVARSPWDDERFRAWARDALAEAGLPCEALRAWCEACLFFHPLGPGTPADYESLRARVEGLSNSSACRPTACSTWPPPRARSPLQWKGWGAAT